MRLFRFDDPVHQEAAELLPWLVNDTLSHVEQAQVERHIAECIACKQEVVHLRTLQAALTREDADPGATQALARLQPRLARADSKGAGAPVLWQALRTHWQATRPWVRGTVIAQFIVIASLSLFASSTLQPKYYHTLSRPAAPASPAATVVVVFDATISERQLRDLVLQLSARIVDGPSPAGAYTLEVEQAQQRSVLAQLRAQSVVKFAEPGAAIPSAR